MNQLTTDILISTDIFLVTIMFVSLQFYQNDKEKQAFQLNVRSGADISDKRKDIIIKCSFSHNFF